MGKKKPKQIVIDLFGGVRAVARVLGLSPGAVSRWGERVPQRHHEKLLDVAEDSGKRLTADMLTRGV